MNMNLSKNNDYVKQTEVRLYAYKDLKAKIYNDMLDLNDLKREKTSEKSRDIIYRSVSGGVSISPEEIQEMKIQRLSRVIREGLREIARIEDAVKSVENDYYSDVIKLRYFSRMTDENVAEKLSCDVSTVRRNRKRLLKQIAVRFYGLDAVAL
jgi:hypothetical protein